MTHPKGHKRCPDKTLEETKPLSEEEAAALWCSFSRLASRTAATAPCVGRFCLGETQPRVFGRYRHQVSAKQNHVDELRAEARKQPRARCCLTKKKGRRQGNPRRGEHVSGSICGRAASASHESSPRPYPDWSAVASGPCEPNFIRYAEDPTREEICLDCMATSLRGMVGNGQISEAAADRELWLYRVSLEEQPFSSGSITNPTREQFQAVCRLYEDKHQHRQMPDNQRPCLSGGIIMNIKRKEKTREH